MTKIEALNTLRFYRDVLKSNWIEADGTAIPRLQAILDALDVAIEVLEK